MLAASTLRAGLHEQDSGTMDSHLLVVSGVSSCLHSEAEMNPNERAACATPASKAKRTATPTPKCDAKPSTEEYEQLWLLLPQCCLLLQLLFLLFLFLLLRLLSPR